jgi:catechol 2,3-dioxygenase-like lactoylglutathione lyase family enzyme
VVIDHLGLDVRDYGTSRDFYAAALAPLGYEMKKELPAEPPGVPDRAGFGVTHAIFWIAGGGAVAPPLHFAFTAASRAQVDAFHRAALRAGGRDNGPPGLRPHYHPNYYAAFVFDPDGHNIEAVCHAPGSPADQSTNF